MSASVIIQARDVRRDFERAAPTYDACADLQREVLEHTLMALKPHVPASAKVLDVGCGTGYLAALCRRHGLSWRMTGVDAAPAMSMAARNTGMRTVCGDARLLPFADATFDAVCCSLVLQWVEPQMYALREIGRVLTRDGRAVVAVMGDGTLKELADVLGERRVIPFPTITQLKLEAGRAGLHILQAETTRYLYMYSSLKELMLRLRAIGASNKRADRQRGLTTPGWFEAAEAEYCARYGGPQGIHATWHVHTLLLENRG